ncbi:MAG: OFA family MFS transporter [Oscillospiraceae bacterium]|nr:OFA family MFS transporter [Oscillospiraceae bacterium]
MKNNQGIKTILAAVAIQMTLGIAYIWSVFQTGIANSIFGGNNAAAGMTFSLLLATLTIGSVIGGKLAVKYSIRRVVLIGGVILSAGFFLASFTTSSFPWLLWGSYGVMGGVGMGFTYSTTIACAQKWYPHKKGFVTGIIVSSLGFGGVVFTPIVEMLIEKFGGQEIGEPNTFIVLSVIFLVVCTAGGLLLKNPPDGYMADKASAGAAPAAVSLTPTQMLRTPKFYLVTGSLLLACMGGLMMIGFAKPIAVAKGLEATAMYGVLAISMFNSLGRLVWGMISDKLGRINTIILLLSGTTVLSLLVNMAESWWIYVLIACIGFFYGGFLSNFPSLTADLFGAAHMATNYGFVLLGFGTGAIVSSQIAGYYRNIAAEAGDINLMFPAFIIASCCSAAAIVLMIILRKLSKQSGENK